MPTFVVPALPNWARLLTIFLLLHKRRVGVKGSRSSGGGWTQHALGLDCSGGEHRFALQRNTRIEEDLVDQLFNSSEKQLARILLLLANFGKEGQPSDLISNISQETLAEMIGTTRSRVSFFLNKFRKLGFIEYNGSMHDHSSLLNAILHD